MSSSLVRVLSALERGLSPLAGGYMLIGGLAVVLRGFPRHTDDIDLTVLGDVCSPRRVYELLTEHGFAERVKDAVSFAEKNQVLLLRENESGIEIDSWLPFEIDAVKRAQQTAIEEVNFPVATVEDLVIYKAVAFRERDQRDIEEMLRLHGTAINRARVLAVVAQFAEALEAPERVAEVTRLLQKR